MRAIRGALSAYVKTAYDRYLLVKYECYSLYLLYYPMLRKTSVVLRDNRKIYNLSENTKKFYQMKHIFLLCTKVQENPVPTC